MDANERNANERNQMKHLSELSIDTVLPAIRRAIGAKDEMVLLDRPYLRLTAWDFINEYVDTVWASPAGYQPRLRWIPMHQLAKYAITPYCALARTIEPSHHMTHIPNSADLSLTWPKVRS